MASKKGSQLPEASLVADNDSVIIVTGTTPTTKIATKAALLEGMVTDAELSAGLDNKATVADLVTHTSNETNPHSVTKTQVGLSDVDNTSDLAKPVSTVTQSALNTKANTAHTQAASTITDFDTAVTNNLSVTANTAKNSYPSADATKLAGIAPGATANDTDANLKNRANHIGSQAINTVVGLQDSLGERAFKTAITVGPAGSNADYVCDGTADNIQIQSAIDAVYTAGGGIVQLNQGTFNISTSIFLKSSVILQGSGAGTKLLLSNATNLPVAKISNYSNIQIRDLQIDGNRVNQSTTDDNNGSGIAIRDTVSNIFIRNVYITATAANGIYTQGTITNLNVIDCETNATGKRGVHISANGAKILGGYFHDTLDHDGIQFGDTASNCLVIGAYCYNNAFKGIEVQVGSTNVSVIGCHVYDNGDVGVAFPQGANNCKVVDCEVYGNNSHGIHIDLTASNPSQYALVQGNTVINNGDALGESGIVIDNSSYARVIGNHVAGNQRHNILLTTATFCTVMGNVCMNGSATTGTTTGDGIALEGNSLNNIVSGNIGTDIQVTKTQRYGVSVTAGSNNNIITSNQLSGNLTGSLSDSGTSTSVNNNII